MKLIKLNDICNFVKGSIGIAKALPGDYTLVTTGSNHKTCNTYQFDTKAVCIPLVSSTGHGHASLNNVHYHEGKFALGTILVALTAKDESILDIQFLHLYLQQMKDQVLVPLMSGAANVTLSITKLKTVEIPLPSIEKQKEIVTRFTSIEKETNKLKQEPIYQQSLLKKLRQQILQDAIEGKLTEDWRTKNPDVEPAKELLERIKAEKEQLIKDKKIKKQKPLPLITEEEKPFKLPEKWEWCRLEIILDELLGGYAFKSSSFIGTGNKQVLRLGNIRPYLLRLDVNPVFITEEIAKLAINSQLKTNDILITMTGTRGKRDYCYTVLLKPSHFKNKELYLNQRVGCLKFNQNIYSDYYDHCLKSNVLLEQVFSTATGAANQANIGSAMIRSWIIPLPPLQEQKAIVEKVEKLFAICDELEEEIDNSKAHSEQLMQSVLREAFISI